MAGVNKVILVGRLGKDPEVRYTPSGTAVSQFSIATSDEWKDKETGEKQERTEWHRIVAWRKLGEVCGEYLKKGTLVYIEGKLQTRQWEDRDGNKRYTTEIVAHNMTILSSKKSSGYCPSDEDEPVFSKKAAQREKSATVESSTMPEDDIPF